MTNLYYKRSSRLYFFNEKRLKTLNVPSTYLKRTPNVPQTYPERTSNVPPLYFFYESRLKSLNVPSTYLKRTSNVPRKARNGVRASSNPVLYDLKLEKLETGLELEVTPFCMISSSKS